MEDSDDVGALSLDLTNQAIVGRKVSINIIALIKPEPDCRFRRINVLLDIALDIIIGQKIRMIDSFVGKLARRKRRVLRPEKMVVEKHQHVPEIFPSTVKQISLKRLSGFSTEQRAVLTGKFHCFVIASCRLNNQQWHSLSGFLSFLTSLKKRVERRKRSLSPHKADNHDVRAGGKPCKLTDLDR